MIQNVINFPDNWFCSWQNNDYFEPQDGFYPKNKRKAPILNVHQVRRTCLNWLKHGPYIYNFFKNWFLCNVWCPFMDNNFVEIFLNIQEAFCIMFRKHRLIFLFLLEFYLHQKVSKFFGKIGNLIIFFYWNKVFLG